MQQRISLLGLVIQLICKKHNFGDPNKLAFLTLAGLLLDSSLSFGDYGLGNLFTAWQVKLCELAALREDTISHIEVILPNTPEFLGTKSTAFPVERCTTIAEVTRMVFKKFNLSSEANYSCTTREKLRICPTETLEQHGFGTLFTAVDGMCLVFTEITNRPRSAYQKRARYESKYQKVKEIVEIKKGDEGNIEESIQFSPWEHSPLRRKHRVRSRSLILARHSREGTNFVLQSECSRIIYSLIEDAMANSERLQNLITSLKGLNTSQLGAVENFINSLITPAESIPSSAPAVASMGPIYRRSSNADEVPTVATEDLHKTVLRQSLQVDTQSGKKSKSVKLYDSA